MTQDNFQDGSPFTAEGLDSVVNAIGHEAILSGGVPSVGTGNYDVDLTACDYVVGGTDYSISADTVTLSSASPADRVDIITADTTPGFNVVEGSPATNPNAPAIPADEVLIAAVFVDSGSSSLVASDINEYRVVLTRNATTLDNVPAANFAQIEVRTITGTIPSGDNEVQETISFASEDIFSVFVVSTSEEISVIHNEANDNNPYYFIDRLVTNSLEVTIGNVTGGVSFDYKITYLKAP